MVAVTPHVRVLPTREDNAFSMEPALLDAAIKEDLAAGEGHAGHHQSLRCAQSLILLRQTSDSPCISSACHEGDLCMHRSRATSESVGGSHCQRCMGRQPSRLALR
jgi:hypothetical protein